ncbi:hypothetical protein [uncultured Streptococcus sp.]|uniref:hypothetical protein n=1 Tax=uncultured Streptococcus sp. TaxID=83427 RepID=UPI00280C1DBF|nr:hypothetical protein [uncultured Streptococcus sp.]
MFWNLVRYEFKNVNKWYLALYAAVLVLSALIGIQAQTYNNLPVKESQPVLLIFLATVFGGMMITLGISTIFLIIKRFKGSVYDRQGYLTLTLPVSEHYIIIAKLLGGLVWSILSYIVFILSVLIIFFLTPIEKDFTVLYNFISPYLSYGWLYALSLFVGSITWILSIYLSISIGQLFNEYRTAMGILAYIVIAIVIGYVSIFFRIENNFNMMIGTEILRDLFLSAIYYLGTYYILKNKVNLQ